MKSEIYSRKSTQSGPTIAILGGIHGDEPVGVTILNQYKNYTPLCGTLILIHGNPRAIQTKIRYTEKDLNRCFLNKTGKTYEHIRAREIRKVLKTCDAVLDIHSYDPKWNITFPFIICEKTSVPIAKGLGISRITTNWKQFHKGSTDHYMDTVHKIGICLESGPKNRIKETTRVAHRTVQLLLSIYKMNKKSTHTIHARVQKLKKLPFNQDGSCSLK